MLDDDERPRPASGRLADPTGDEARPNPGSRRPVLEITAIAIAILLALGVVVAALNMKFEADQARWQQRQTCLEWYRLQADYGLGPWYEKLPAAAADCGGGTADNGDPLIPGGTKSAVEPGGTPASNSTVPPKAPTSTVPPRAPTSVAPTTTAEPNTTIAPTTTTTAAARPAR